MKIDISDFESEIPLVNGDCTTVDYLEVGAI